MADFYLRASNDWDLEAIIRGWGGGGGSAVVQLPPPPANSVLGFEFDKSEVFTGGNLVNELEEMYKPFVVQMDQQPEMMTISPCSSSFVMFDHPEDDVEKPKIKDNVDLDVEDHVQSKSSCRRRKSKQKIVREVHRGVGEDGVAMDKWNWRKYGQKAIKGSPFPRSYYRCSSSGGCHARKHVEQSKDDCHTFIVTYIADHSHLPPTRRHAQAGRKITKFSSSSTTKVTPSQPNNTMTWTVSGPSIIEDADNSYRTAVMGPAGSTTSGLEEVMKDLLSAEYADNNTAASFDQDFNIWEFDPFFSASIC
ncbi:hypothetical protein V2J09_004881 [Rumex salicifolius]